MTRWFSFNHTKRQRILTEGKEEKHFNMNSYLVSAAPILLPATPSESKLQCNREQSPFVMSALIHDQYEELLS